LSSFSKLISLLWKDILVEIRRPIEVLSAAIFVLTASSIVGFALSKYIVDYPVKVLVSGLGVTIIQLFLAVFIATMGFVREADRGTLYGLKASPISPYTVFLSKLLLAAILMEALTIVAITSEAFFGGLSVTILKNITLISTLAGLYLATVSAFASAIAIYLEARSVLIPTVILALSAPLVQTILVLLATQELAVSATILLLASIGFMIVTIWLSQYILEV